MKEQFYGFYKFGRIRIIEHHFRLDLIVRCIAECYDHQTIPMKNISKISSSHLVISNSKWHFILLILLRISVIIFSQPWCDNYVLVLHLIGLFIVLDDLSLSINDIRNCGIVSNYSFGCFVNKYCVFCICNLSFLMLCFWYTQIWKTSYGVPPTDISRTLEI